jgi:hypothetical protein
MGMGIKVLFENWRNGRHNWALEPWVQLKRMPRLVLSAHPRVQLQCPREEDVLLSVLGFHGIGNSALSFFVSILGDWVGISPMLNWIAEKMGCSAALR